LRKFLVGIGLGLGAALLALGAGRLPFIQTVELKTYDWRMRATSDPDSARKDIVLVTIDETSIRKLEPVVGRWPWPRLAHAQLLNFLGRARPRVVLYDVMFTEADRSKFTLQDEDWTGEESDEELAKATAHAGVLVHVADAVQEASRETAAPGTPAPDLPGPRFVLNETIEERPVVTPPIAPILAESRAVGHNFIALDADGPVRRYVPFIRYRGRYVPALGIAGAAIVLGLTPHDVRLDDTSLWLGNRRMPLVSAERVSFSGGTHRVRRALIRFPGVWLDGRPTYKTYSFFDLFKSEIQLLNNEKPLVDPSALAAKIVVVGATAPGLHDNFTVPFVGKMPGPEVHAAVVDSVLSNRFLEPAPRWAGNLATFAASIALGLAGVFLGPWVAVATAVAVVGALLAGSTWQFGYGRWYPLVEPIGAVALATFGGVAYQYLVEGREKRRVKRIFSRYVSKDVYDQLIANPEDAQLGGTRRHMSVLFSDIRGFTSVSERGEPEAIVGQLNQYFSAMVPVVFAHKGTVDKFVGDMVMALFGAPLDDVDHADHAVQAALAMIEELARMNAQWAADGLPTLDIGIGINTGDMVAGNLGSESIMAYTVIGDNVNLGARLESLNRQYRTRIIISDATRAALKARYDIRALGDVVVKGKSVPVKIFEVAPPPAVSAVLNTYSPLSDNEKAAVLPQKAQGA
jgi:adenylate cyclase